MGEVELVDAKPKPMVFAHLDVSPTPFSDIMKDVRPAPVYTNRHQMGSEVSSSASTVGLAIPHLHDFQTPAEMTQTKKYLSIDNAQPSSGMSYSMGSIDYTQDRSESAGGGKMNEDLLLVRSDMSNSEFRKLQSASV